MDATDVVGRMIALGFGKYVRSDRVYALEPLAEGERGNGARTRVWVEGIDAPLIASRSERAILADLGGGRARRRRQSPQDEGLF
ncbi:MAG TPA: hypothetical protein VHC45_12200 [Gaiellaceae bacterium]|nr:hypothetical protein [Gaiellaceae bacterium]